MTVESIGKGYEIELQWGWWILFRADSDTGIGKFGSREAAVFWVEDHG